MREKELSTLCFYKILASNDLLGCDVLADLLLIMFAHFNFAVLNKMIRDMKDLIACCGLDCEKCDARKATVNNDDALRERTAKMWAEANNTTIMAEHINCMGCRVEGAKFIFCSEMCPVRKCVRGKGYSTCAECAEIDTCGKVGQVFRNAPEARGNLKS